jgi:hypothetical protein
MTKIKNYSEYDKELAMGTKIEKEHNDLYDEIEDYFQQRGEKCPWSADHFYAKIAKAHIKEVPDYYSRLKLVEK